MITLTAKINLLSGDDKALLLGSTDLSGNNISRVLSKVVGYKKKGSNPFIIGASTLGDGSTFSDGVEYFIGDQPSNENGYFSNPYSIIINDKNATLTSLTIEFDSTNGRHPKNIKIDGKEYIDDDPIFTVTGLTAQSSHTIYIDNWNSPLYPLVITGIYAEVLIEIDRRNIISLSSSIFDRSDLKLPSFGIISNKGNIEFNDLDGEIRDYAEQLILQSGLSCEIRLNNTLVDGASELVATMETDQWDYDNDNRVVSVSIKDDLEEWQDISISPIIYSFTTSTEKSFAWMYERLYEMTPKKYNMLELYELDDITFNRLNYTYIKRPMLKEGSLWSAWNKMCIACQARIYKSSSGRTIFTSNIRGY